VSGSKTSEKVPVRAYRRGTPSGGAVPERPLREPPLLSLLESRELLVLLAIMLLDAVLRFYGLGFQSLWSEELASWDFSNRETISQVIGGVRSDDNAPLYFLILRFAQWIIGDSEWALRFPSAFAGWLCIPAIYHLGRRLYSEREGIMAAAGLAYLIFSMDYYSAPTKEQFREAALYVVSHEDKNTLVVRCDTQDRLDYYLKTREMGQRNDAEACRSSDFQKIEDR
jgi:hypothetical protein